MDENIIELTGMDTSQIWEDITWLNNNIPEDKWKIEISDQWMTGKYILRVEDPEYMLLAKLRFTR